LSIYLNQDTYKSAETGPQLRKAGDTLCAMSYRPTRKMWTQKVVYQASAHVESY